MSMVKFQPALGSSILIGRKNHGCNLRSIVPHPGRNTSMKAFGLWVDFLCSTTSPQTIVARGNSTWNIVVVSLLQHPKRLCLCSFPERQLAFAVEARSSLCHWMHSNPKIGGAASAGKPLGSLAWGTEGFQLHIFLIHFAPTGLDVVSQSAS